MTFAPDKALPPTFKTLRTRLRPESDYSLTAHPGWLRLYGGRSAFQPPQADAVCPPLAAFCITATTEIDFAPQNFQQVAGLVLFYDTCNWIYAYITWDECVNARTLQILRCD